MVFCRNCEFWRFRGKGIKIDNGTCKNKEIKKYLKEHNPTTYSTNYCWFGIEKER